MSLYPSHLIEESEAVGGPIRVTSQALTDGSEVFRVEIGTIQTHCAIIDCVNERQAMEIFRALEKTVEITVF